MAKKELMTYTVTEVSQMLGLPEKYAYKQIEKNSFMFPVLEITEGRYVIPRKPVDAFLQQGKVPNSIGNKGRPKIWFKGEFVWWRFEVPIDLAEAFKIVVQHMNKSLSSPITYNDAKRLAIEEFIERRPISDD